MAYRVTWKKRLSGIVVGAEDFEALEDAIKEAKLARVTTRPIVITVTDDAGEQHYMKIKD